MSKIITTYADGIKEEREMTAEEYAQYQSDILRIQTRIEAEAEAKAQAQVKRQALLDKLGITEEEARLLLGGN